MLNLQSWLQHRTRLNPLPILAGYGAMMRKINIMKTIATDAPNTWTAKEAAHYRATAQACFKHSYDHGAKPDPDNCSGCALRDASSDDGPNYAGWARLFVEAGYPIPTVWREAFGRELNSSNELYKAALLKSLLTFGHPNWINNETL